MESWPCGSNFQVQMVEVCLYCHRLFQLLAVSVYIIVTFKERVIRGMIEKHVLLHIAGIDHNMGDRYR